MRSVTVPRRRTMPEYRVAIVGAGFAGLAAAHYLRKAGIDDLVIYERSKSVGGTWFQNSYPGAGCDTPSYQYSFSFVRWNWSRTHALRPELVQYFDHVVEVEGVAEKLRLGEEVREVEWFDEERRYRVTTTSGDSALFDAVVSAVGLFNAPHIPDLPGMSTFKGPLIHSAGWSDGIDLSGLRVGLVGTGSSSAQLAPALSELAEELVIFQREPGWMLPKGERLFGASERARLSGLAGRYLRLKLFLQSDRAVLGGRHARSGTARNSSGHAAALSFIERELAGRPDLIELVTPRYEYGGKRTVRSDTFYKTLLRDNVQLVPSAVSHLNADGLVDDTGVEYKLDAVVFATGFEAATYLKDLEIVGRTGQSLQDIWQGEPSALLGMSVPSVPNFFMMYGPNTNAGPLVFLLETQARFIAGMMRRARKRQAVVEARQLPFAVYNRWLQAKLRATVWGENKNYFQSASGRVVTQWPRTATLYRLLVATLGRVGHRFDSRLS